MILRTYLRDTAADDVLPDNLSSSHVPRFDAAGRMKTDLMSELEFLQLLAELGKEGLVLPDLYTALPEFPDSTVL